MPQQCRTWPFWPENCSSRQAWEGAKAAAPCPGMGRGKLVPAEEVHAILQREIQREEAEVAAANAAAAGALGDQH